MRLSLALPLALAACATWEGDPTPAYDGGVALSPQEDAADQRAHFVADGVSDIEIDWDDIEDEVEDEPAEPASNDDATEPRDDSDVIHADDPLLGGLGSIDDLGAPRDDVPMAYMRGRFPGGRDFEGVTTLSVNGSTYRVDLVGEHGWAMASINLFDMPAPTPAVTYYSTDADGGPGVEPINTNVWGCAGPSLGDWSQYDGHDYSVGVISFLDEETGHEVIQFETDDLIGELTIPVD